MSVPERVPKSAFVMSTLGGAYPVVAVPNMSEGETEDRSVDPTLMFGGLFPERYGSLT